MATIRVYKQSGRKRKMISGYGCTNPQSVIAHMEGFASSESRETGNTAVRSKDSAGCTEFHIGSTRIFYWIIGRNQDARGYLGDSD